MNEPVKNEPVKKRKIWMSMGDHGITVAERKIDALMTPLTNLEQRNLQLKTQRRRALRRALSLQRLMEAFLRIAKDGTAEELDEVLREAQGILNIPFCSAISGMEEPDPSTINQPKGDSRESV